VADLEVAEVERSVAELVAAAAAGRPGLGTVALLARVDPDRLSCDARIDVLIASGKAAAWLAGIDQRTLAAIATDPADGAGDYRSARETVGSGRDRVCAAGVL
jgi:hypothetical protein